MEAPATHTTILVPREGVNDDVVRIVEWLVAEGDKVREKQPLVVLETTKTTFELESPAAGYVFPMVAAGTEICVGATLALVASTPLRPRVQPVPTTTAPASVEQTITKKARALIDANGLTADQFAGLSVVRE